MRQTCSLAAAQGIPNEQIAAVLGISRSTLERHFTHELTVGAQQQIAVCNGIPIEEAQVCSNAPRREGRPNGRPKLTADDVRALVGALIEAEAALRGVYMQLKMSGPATATAESLARARRLLCGEFGNGVVIPQAVVEAKRLQLMVKRALAELKK